MTVRTQAPDDARPGDAVTRSWVEAMPTPIRPYLRLMRLDRPIGAWLLFWPCVFGLFLGAAARGEAPNFWYVFLCGIGSIVMRGAGCTFNDIVDRDFDAKVERTRGRPIPSGAVSVKTAALFAVALALAGLFILLSFNAFAIGIGVSSLFLVVVYPFMKRITWWPQAWLGLTFNWGVVFGYAAETGSLDADALVFYVGTFFWTLGYDTIYAHQDKEDDILIGVKSSAIWLGSSSLPWLYGFYGAAAALMIAGGLMARLGLVFVLAMFLVAAHFFWQLLRLDIDDRDLCLAVFKSNHHAGALIAGALLAGLIAGV